MGFLFLEIGLRLFPGLLPLETHSQLSQKRWLAPIGTPRFLAEYRQLWADDAYLRERMKPNVDVVIHGNPEYPVWPIKTSDLGQGEAGFRDTLPDQPPFAVLLGDSFGFGVGVPQEEVWSERLERASGLPVVNLSQVGASSLQEARIYARYGRDLPARIVFWQFFQNDLKDNLRFAQWLQPEVDIPQAARLSDQPCASPVHRFLKRYALSYELPLFWRRACEYAAMTPTPVYQADSLSLTFCLDHDICDEQVQARMLSDGWPLTRQALLETLDQTEQAGATLVVIIVPSKEQVYADQYRQAADFPAAYDMDRLVEPLRQFCAETGLHCLDLTEPLRAEARQNRQLYFPVDIHWNAVGQAFVAEVVADYLRREGLMSSYFPEPSMENEVVR